MTKPRTANAPVLIEDDPVDSRKVSKAHLELVRAAMKRLTDQYGCATAQQLLDLARPTKSPLHALFDWDDRRAGEKFRLQQAGAFIRCVKFKAITEDGVKVFPGHISVLREEGGRAYVPTLKVLTDEDLYAQAVAEAREMYLRLEERYRLFKEFKPINEIIAKLLK